MANVLENIIAGPGVGSSVLFGNEIKASIELIARHCCCQSTVSLGVNEVVVEDIVPQSGVEILEAFRAPVITLNTNDSTSLSSLALSRPNQTVAQNGCDTVCLVIINCSGEDQLFNTDISISRVAKTDTNPLMIADCAYVFYYDFNKDFWFPANNLESV
ncbi:MAG: hypothetical protein Salg2KO_23250 [Salibacteraceae bacterium]